VAKNFKVTIIASGLTLSNGGPSKTISFFKNALAAKVFALTDKKKYELEGSAIQGAIHLINSESFIGKYFSFSKISKDVEASIAESDILSCHIFWRYNVVLTYYLSKKYKIPYIFVPHGSIDPYVLKRNSFVKKIFLYLIGKRFLRDASRIICASETEKENFLKVFNSEDISVINWPVEVNPDYSSIDKNQVYKKYNLSKYKKKLLFLGRLHPVKRPIELIRCFAKSHHQNAQLIIVGPFESYSKDQINKIIESEGLDQDDVRVLGPLYHKEKEEVLYVSDAIVSISERENFGHVLVEALAHEKPIIVSKGCYIYKELQLASCGIFVKSNEDIDIIKALDDFITMSNQAHKKMGKNGKSWVSEKLNIETFNSSLKEVIGKIINNNA